MKTFHFKLEEYLRTSRLFLDYLLFRLSHPLKKPLPRNIKNILIIEQKFIGDLIVITPLIRVLKHHFQNANIDLLVNPSMKSVLSLNPNINKIITNPEELQEYDLGILLHEGSKKTSKLLKQKARFRIGCTRPLFREPIGYYLHRKTKPSLKLKHKIEDNLDVLKTIGISAKDKHLELYVEKEAQKSISLLLKQQKITEKDFLVVIHPCVRHAPSHEWLPERFTELAKILTEKYKYRIIFSGSEKDINTIDKITTNLDKNSYLNLAGKTSIQELFALIQRADLVISVDTGAMHIAAALKTPVIALFGAGNPKVWSPYSENSTVIYKNQVCTSCMKLKCPHKGEKEKECMKAIQVHDILESIDKK